MPKYKYTEFVNTPERERENLGENLRTAVLACVLVPTGLLLLPILAIGAFLCEVIDIALAVRKTSS